MHSVTESPIIRPINTDRTAFPLTFPHFLFLLPSFLQLEEENLNFIARDGDYVQT